MEFDSQRSPRNICSPRFAIVEVCIPTTTAIVYDSQDPNYILVGRSAKHALPVLPGGKIDLADIVSSSIVECATVGMLRELREEVRIEACGLKLFEVGSDHERDVRMISAASLRGTLVEAAVRELADEELVLGRYGVPDYVFSCPVDRKAVTASDELQKLFWINMNDVDAQTLGAGHGALIVRYRENRSRAS